MRGQGPVQVVKMKSAIQTFPASNPALENSSPVCAVSVNGGTVL
jgi:hypothetical protein